MARISTRVLNTVKAPGEGPGAKAVSFVPTSNITATNVQDALAQLAVSTSRVATDNAAPGGAIWDYSVTGIVKALLYASAADKFLYSVGANEWAEAPVTSQARAFLAAGDPAGQRAVIGAVIGTDVQAHSPILDAISGLTTTGLIVRSASGVVVTRTLTAPAAGIVVSNGGGVSGDPTLALADDLAAVEGLATTGLAVRTGTSAWTTRALAGTAAEVTVTNGDGVAGAPIISLPAALTFTGKTVAGGTFSSPTLTGATVTLAGDPSAAMAAATKQYVDNVAAGLDTKQSVRAATTANITLSGTQTIDGIALVAGDRVLVKNQTAAAENGIYIVAVGAWARSSDADAWVELPGAYTFVEAGGTTNGGTGWTCNVAAGGTLGTTAVTWAQFWGAGTYTAGTGLTLTGTQFSLSASFSLITGYVLAAQFPALTGDVTTTAGALATTIAAKAVSYAKMQDISATARVLGRKTAGSGSPEELTLSELLDLVGSAAQGDILFRGASGWARLTAGVSGNFLKTLGAGSDPAWATPAGGGDMLAANNLSDVVNKLIGANTLQVVSFGGAQSLSSTEKRQAGGNLIETGTWTPTVTAINGSLTSYSASGRYVRIGGSVWAEVSISIPDIGTSAVGIVASLPFPFTTAGSAYGKETTVRGWGLAVDVNLAYSGLVIVRYDGGFPLVNGCLLQVGCRYGV